MMRITLSALAAAALLAGAVAAPEARTQEDPDRVVYVKGQGEGRGLTRLRDGECFVGVGVGEPAHEHLATQSTASRFNTSSVCSANIGARRRLTHRGPGLDGLDRDDSQSTRSPTATRSSRVAR